MGPSAGGSWDLDEPTVRVETKQKDLAGKPGRESRESCEHAVGRSEG